MSGARIVLHLALELRRRGGGVGAAALCGGGGQGDALILHVPARRDPDGTAVQTPAPVTPRGRRGRRAADVPALVEGAREGDARSVARLISLVEDASPALREVAAALSPHTGHAQVLGLTGSPGRRQVDDDDGAGAGVPEGRQAGRRPRRRPVVPVLRWRAARRPGADAGPRRRQRRLHPVDGLPRSPGRAGVGHAAGAAGARRGRLRRRADRDRRRRPVRAGDRLARRHHAGARRARDGRRHPGGQGRDPRGRRPLRRQQGRPGRRRPDGARPALHAVPRRPALRAGHWRPPICKTVASRETDNGIDEVLAKIEEHRAWLESSGEGHRRRERAGRPRDRGHRAGRAARADGRRARLGRPRLARRAGRGGGDRPLPGRRRAARRSSDRRAPARPARMAG